MELVKSGMKMDLGMRTTRRQGRRAMCRVLLAAAVMAVLPVSSVLAGSYTLTLGAAANWSTASWGGGTPPTGGPGAVLGTPDMATITWNANYSLTLNTSPIYLTALTYSAAANGYVPTFAGGSSSSAYIDTITWNPGGNQNSSFNWTVNNLNTTGAAGTGNLLTIYDNNSDYVTMSFTGPVNATNGVKAYTGASDSRHISFSNLNISAGGLEIGRGEVQVSGSKTITGDLKLSTAGTAASFATFNNTGTGGAIITGNANLGRGLVRLQSDTTTGMTIQGNMVLDNTATGVTLDLYGGKVNVTGALDQSAAAAASPLTIQATNTSAGTLNLNSTASRSGATTITGGVVNLNAAYALNASTATPLVTISGGTVNAMTANALNTTINLNGGVLNANTANSLGTSTVNLSAAGRLFISSGVIAPATLNWTGGMLGLNNTGALDQAVYLTSGQTLNCVAGQNWRRTDALNYNLQAKVASGAALIGDLSNVQYGTLNGNNSVEIYGGAILAATAGPEPLASDIQGGGTLIYGVVANTANQKIGGIYGMAQFNENLYSTPGNFAGTLTEPSNGAGFTIDLASNKTFGAANLQTVNGTVNITGTKLMTLAAGLKNSSGTPVDSLTVTRTGVASGQTGDTTGALILTLNAANVITANQNYTVTNGQVSIVSATSVANGGTLIIGSGATLNLSAAASNMTTGTVNVMDGGAIYNYGRSVTNAITRSGTTLFACEIDATGTYFTMPTSGALYDYARKSNVVLLQGNGQTKIAGGNVVLGQNCYLIGANSILGGIASTSSYSVVADSGATDVGIAMPANNTISIPINLAGVNVTFGTTTPMTSMNTVTSANPVAGSRFSSAMTGAVTFNGTGTALSCANVTVQSGGVYLYNTNNITGNVTINGGAFDVFAPSSLTLSGTSQYYLSGTGQLGFPVGTNSATIGTIINVSSSANAYLGFGLQGSGAGTLTFSDVRLGSGTTLTLKNNGNATASAINLSHITLNGNATINSDSLARTIGNITGSGKLTIGAQPFNLNGAIQTGVTVSPIGSAGLVSLLGSNFSLSGGEFENPVAAAAAYTFGNTFTTPIQNWSGTITAANNSNTVYSSGSAITITNGQDGNGGGAGVSAWGSNLTLQFKSTTSFSDISIAVNSSASGQIANEFAGMVLVPAGMKGNIWAIPGALPALGTVGKVVLDNVHLQEGSTLGHANFGTGGTWLTNAPGIEIKQITLDGNATLTRNGYSSSGRIDQISGSGKTLTVTCDATLAGPIDAGVKVSVNNSSGVTVPLAVGFALNGTLEANGTSVISAAALNAGGGLTLATNASLGGTGSITGANVNLTGSNSLYSSSTFTITGKGLTVSGLGNQITSGTIAASSATINADGSLLVLGTLSGPATINNLGQFQLGNGGNTGSFAGKVANSGTLIFNHSDAVTFNSQITGTGAIVQAGPGTLTLGHTANSFTSVTVTGGEFDAAKLPNATLSVQTGGTFKLTAGSANHYLSTLASGNLTLGGGKLDLTNNDLLLTGVTGDVSTRAYNINKAIGTAMPLGAATMTTGVLTGDQWNNFNNNDKFDTQTVTSDQLVLRYTYTGDATLDGKITMDDYLQLDTGYLFGGSGWANGDFNHDGSITMADYVAIDTNFLAQGSTAAQDMINLHASWFGASYEEALANLQAVPEPTSLGLLALGALGLLSRRRR